MKVQLGVGRNVRTPLGKGVVRELRNSGRVLVDVHGRAVVFSETELSPVDLPKSSRDRRADLPGSPTTPYASSRSVPSEIDLHGLTVEEALARAARAVNDALLVNLPELRFIHGRSGGKIRGALHRWLREIPSVSGFRLDSHNPGVTVAMF